MIQHAFKRLEYFRVQLSTVGHKNAEILKIFENFALCLHRQSREADEELLLEVMDTFVGCCPPVAQVLPDEELKKV